MHTPRALLVAALAAALLASATRAATPRYSTPVAYATACRADTARAAACALVGTFFRDVNASRFDAACALLGDRLRLETGGGRCPAP